MRKSINELEDGKYYLLTRKEDNKKWYFRFKNIDDKGDLWDYGYFILVSNGIYLNNERCLLSKSIVETFYYDEVEVESAIVLDMLPEIHPAKIFYIRNLKIKALLKC